MGVEPEAAPSRCEEERAWKHAAAAGGGLETVYRK
jgi:hypothetical protein